MLAAAVVLLLVGACGGIPTSGPVTKVKDDGGFGESTVRYAPALPAVGASPQEIVLGYLDAMLAFPVSTGTASAFLTPAAADSWRPLNGVRVYTRPVVSASQPDRSPEGDIEGTGDRVVVHLTTSQVAHLDQQGSYTRTSGSSELTYILQQVKGEWRIATPQAGMLVNSKYFNDYFRPFDLYMFDRPGRRLVPVPVYLPVGERLATSLIAALARGPAADMADLTRTYVPKVDTLSPSVPVSADGVADVEFDEELRTTDQDSQDRLSAQIIWTLRQVPEIKGVRLSGGATILSRNGLPIQPIGSWGAFGPSTAGTHAYALSGNKAVQIDDDHATPLTGQWGKDAQGAVRIAVSDAGVAGVLAGRSQVLVTNRAGTTGRTYSGSQIITPRWDRDSVLWLVDSPGGRTRVRLVRDETIAALPIGSLAGRNVSTFALSPGGSRYAVTADGNLYVGMIQRDDKNQILRLTDPQRVVIDVPNPTSVVWTSDTQLAYLGGGTASRHVHVVGIDGSGGEGRTGAGALLPDVGAGILVLGSGDPPTRYATDSTQRLWYLPPDGTWHVVKSAEFTGLTYGR